MTYWNWLALIVADYVFSEKSSDAFLLYLPSHGCQLKSHQPRSVGTFKEKCTRSRVRCLLVCLRGSVGEDNTVLHAETTVVSCQQSSQLSLKTNVLLVGWTEVWGFEEGEFWALLQSEALCLGVYNFICKTPLDNVRFFVVFFRITVRKCNFYNTQS